MSDTNDQPIAPSRPTFTRPRSGRERTTSGSAYQAMVAPVPTARPAARVGVIERFRGQGQEHGEVIVSPFTERR